MPLFMYNKCTVADQLNCFDSLGGATTEHLLPKRCREEVEGNEVLRR